MAVFNSTEELKAFVPMIHKHFSWDNDLKPMSELAADVYVKQLMGGEYQLLETAFGDSSLSTEQAALLPYVQKAVAWYTYMDIHDSHRISMSNQGAQQASSSDGTSQPASHYAISDSKFFAAKRADLYADELLEFLELNVNDYPTWKASSAYTQMYSSLLWNTDQLNQYVDAGNSRRLFVRMRSDILYIQDRDIKPLLGDTLYTSLVSEVQAQHTTAISTESLALIKLVRPYLARQALIEAIPALRVQVENGGIHFLTYDGPATKTRETATNEGVRAFSLKLKEQAEGDFSALAKFLDDNSDTYPDYTPWDYTLTDGEPSYRPPISGGNGYVSL